VCAQRHNNQKAPVGAIFNNYSYGQQHRVSDIDSTVYLLEAVLRKYCCGDFQLCSRAQKCYGCCEAVYSVNSENSIFEKRTDLWT
jgi:hypothetical protein